MGNFIIYVSLFIGGFFSCVMFWALVDFYMNRPKKNDAIPVPIKDEDLCKGPHPWMDAPAFQKGAKGNVKVCRACGLIAGTQLAATQNAIDMIETANKLREIEHELSVEFEKLEMKSLVSTFNEELQKGMPQEKIVAAHTAGATYRERFELFVVSKKDEIQKQLDRSN